MTPNTRKNLNKAFSQLRKMGYTTLRNITGGCMCEIRESILKKVNGQEDALFIGYHSRHRETMSHEEFGKVYLYWQGDSEEILKVFKENGIHAHKTHEGGCIILENPTTA